MQLNKQSNTQLNKQLIDRLNEQSNRSLSLQHQSNLDDFPFSIGVSTFYDKDRNGLEDFIRAGYKKAYGAEISITMPILLHIEDGNYKALLGMRGRTAVKSERKSAREDYQFFDVASVNNGHIEENQPFFLEQYLDGTILQAIQNFYPNARTQEIIEIGNLYSNSNRYTIPLFLITAVSSFLVGKKYFALCGTEHVLEILTKSGVNINTIKEASAERLNASKDNWGTYYNTNPKVVCINLLEVMELIESNRFYKKLLGRLEQKISVTAEQLEKYL